MTVHEATPAPVPADATTLFFMEVERIRGADPWISPLGSGILAGVTLDIAHDSRAFSRALGIEHALVLREVSVLTDLGRLKVNDRNERTQRCAYELVPLPAISRAMKSSRSRGTNTRENIIASTGGSGSRGGHGGCGRKKGEDAACGAKTDMG